MGWSAMGQTPGKGLLRRVNIRRAAAKEVDAACMPRDVHQIVTAGLGGLRQPSPAAGWFQASDKLSQARLGFWLAAGADEAKRAIERAGVQLHSQQAALLV